MERKKITQEEFDEIYKQHQEWLNSEGEKGERADFSRADLWGIIFPQPLNLRRANLREVNLRSANLRSANLRGANLQKTILIGANLCGADLQRANLEGAYLQGAYLQDTYLEGADLRGARVELDNLLMAYIEGAFWDKEVQEYLNRVPRINSGSFSKKELEDVNRKLQLLEKEKKQKEKTINDQKKLLKVLEDKFNDHTDAVAEKKQLNEEKEKLKSNIQKLEAQNEEKDTMIASLKEEYDRKIREIKEITDRGKEIETSLSESFESLNSVKDIMKPEIWRLKIMFCLFCGMMFVFLGLLAAIWICAFIDLQGKEVQISRIWIFAAPSLILVGFIWATILQINRAQRMLVSLRKYNRKFEIIKHSLEGYYKVEDKLNKTPDKAKEIFSKIVEQTLYEDVDTDREEERLKLDGSKDHLPAKEVIDQLIDYLQKIRSN